ncbi:MAG: hypothetical protein M1829_001004 [Trizodia sp. TS-e1964]|nr:MAG: hypothetical protein M1829_001004 [Trizodia sp. TS-e1964]
MPNKDISTEKLSSRKPKKAKATKDFKILMSKALSNFNKDPNNSTNNSTMPVNPSIAGVSPSLGSSALMNHPFVPYPDIFQLAHREALDRVQPESGHVGRERDKPKDIPKKSRIKATGSESEFLCQRCAVVWAVYSDRKNLSYSNRNLSDQIQEDPGPPSSVSEGHNIRGVA